MLRTTSPAVFVLTQQAALGIALSVLAGCPGGGGDAATRCGAADTASDLTPFLDGEAFVGNLAGTERHLSGCDDSGGGQALFSFTPPETGTYSFSTDHPETSFDTVLHAFDDCRLANAEIDECNDDTNGTSSELLLDLDAGSTVWLGVGAYDGDSDGSFGLTASSRIDGGLGGCLTLDRIEGEVIPPSGIGLGFRVLGCNGNPAPPLTQDDVTVINDETGVAFNASSEGGAASAPGPNDTVEAYTVLALDFSSSIFNAGAEQDVVNGALAYIDATLVNPTTPLNHSIALIAFGAPDQFDILTPVPTNDPGELQAALSNALAYGSRGTTDLYGTYVQALSFVDQWGTPDALVERFVVVMTDGTHEAGNTEQLRQQALNARGLSEATIYTIGIDGDYDAQTLRELASFDGGFLQVTGSAALGAAFEQAAERAVLLAQSNYVIGVCTPVALGEPSLTLEVRVGSAFGSAVITYPTNDLTGAIDQCDASEVAAQYGG